MSGKPYDSGILKVYLKQYSFDRSILGSAQYFLFFSTSAITLKQWKYHVLELYNLNNFSIVFEAIAGSVSVSIMELNNYALNFYFEQSSGYRVVQLHSVLFDYYYCKHSDF